MIIVLKFELLHIIVNEVIRFYFEINELLTYFKLKCFSVHFDVDEYVYDDQDFLYDLLNTNIFDRQMLSDQNESIDVVVEVLYDKMYVDIYHKDNHNDVQH